MNAHLKRQTRYRILAIDPVGKGFGFAVFEGEVLLDWGLSHGETSHMARLLNRLERLVEFYKPQLLVIEDDEARGSLRRPMAVRKLRTVSVFAKNRGIRLRRVSRLQVQTAFSRGGGRLTKHQVASEIARRYPELALRLPPPRKIWQSEDDRMAIFDATALFLSSRLSLRPVN